MAILSDTDRTRIWRSLMRLNLSWGQVNKTQLRTAVNNADDWIDSVASTYNTVLPAAFRSGASLQEKALLLAVICAARVGPEYVKALLGVDSE